MLKKQINKHRKNSNYSFFLSTYYTLACVFVKNFDSKWNIFYFYRICTNHLILCHQLMFKTQKVQQPYRKVKTFLKNSQQFNIDETHSNVSKMDFRWKNAFSIQFRALHECHYTNFIIPEYTPSVWCRVIIFRLNNNPLMRDTRLKRQCFAPQQGGNENREHVRWVGEITAGMTRRRCRTSARNFSNS